MPRSLEFWFDFASTYSYLSAMRIAPLAEQAGIEVVWRPFLLGPIFAGQGWNTSPFSIYPAKGRYMWRDMERRSARYGLGFRRPAADDPRAFPQHSVLAARIALIAIEEGKGPDFCRAVYLAEFADGRDISSEAVLLDIAQAAGLPDDVIAQATAPENKQRLRAQCNRAMELGLFGAPSFTIGDELFWGDDRLEDAIDWAKETTDTRGDIHA